jgi:glycosyltransferase involved in cell wall biosynthesis
VTVEPAPHVTVVVPTYNRAALVANAIDSALAQDHPALDVVVVDDGSTDDTATVLAAYRDEPRVRLIFRDRNGGVAAAKNTGLDAVPATSTYVGILDSDDTLEPGAIAALVAGFAQAGQPVSQVFGWCQDPETGEMTGTMTHRAGFVTYEDAVCGRFDGEFWQLVRVDLLGDARFDERSGGHEAMVWWPLMRQESAFLVDRVVRLYDRSGTDRVNRPMFHAAGALRKMWGHRVLLERVGADMATLCPVRFADMTLEVAKWAALADERATAWSAIGTAWRTRPSWRVLKVAALVALPGGVARRAYRRLHHATR